MNRKTIAGSAIALVLVTAPVAMALGEGKHKGKGKRAEKTLERLDTDRNGVISPGEWQGSRESFDRFDRNLDGAVTQAELNEGKQKHKDKSLKGKQRLDRDGNGVVTPGEWNGSDESFRRLDTNDDGVLSGTELHRKGKKDR